jgi:putative glutathione S-transferase
MRAQADVRLFQTLIRFDHVYVVYFKCNRNFVHQMPNVANYVRDMYQTPGARPLAPALPV